MLIMIKLFVLIFIFQISGDNSGWELRKDAKGIKVYVRPIEEISFHEFKAITTLENCSINEALEVLLDVSNYETWFPDCINPKVLEQKSKYHDIHYIETVSPWPAQDRYGVYEQITTFSNNNEEVEVVFKALPAYSIEVKDDMVRINEALGMWSLKENNKEVIITYQFKGDPGGNISAWLANAFVVKHPYKTLENFKMLLEE
jgi:hypothetical protein